jgi:antirestriction factor ArdC-like protein
MQRPDVSLVGGFQQWRKTGRMVRRGEHGMMIWIPRKGKKSDESGTAEPEGDVFSLVDAAEGTEVSTNKFFIGTVFDIAQTEPILHSAEHDHYDADAIAATG